MARRPSGAGGLIKLVKRCAGVLEQVVARVCNSDPAGVPLKQSDPEPPLKRADSADQCTMPNAQCLGSTSEAQMLGNRNGVRNRDKVNWTWLRNFSARRCVP